MVKWSFIGCTPRSSSHGTCTDAAASRPQLANTPPPASRDEILALYDALFAAPVAPEAMR